MKLIFVLVLVIIIAIFAYQYTVMGSNTITIVISGILQGNILPYKEQYGEYKGKNVGGIAYLSGFHKMVKEKKNNQYIFLDCGDNYSGTPETYYTHGEAVVTGLNALGLDAMAIGNREFDFGAARLRKNISDSNFTYLGTNLKDTSKDRMEFEYVKILNSGNYKIGLMGIVPPQTAVMTESSNTKGFIFSEISKSIPGYVKFLREKGADAIMVITQLDIDVDEKHIDFLISCGIDVIQVLEYRSKKKKFQKIKNSYLIAHDGYAKGSNVQLFDAEFKAGKLECSNFRRVYIEKEKIKPDLELSGKLNEYVRKIDEIMNKVIGKIDQDYRNEYYEESGLGNFICNTIKDKSGADIALQNSGGIRSDLKKGNFTIRMLHDILPFDNDIILLKLKGDMLYSIFETVTELKYGVLQVAGLTYRIDKKSDKPLVSLLINEKPVEKDKEYLVVTNSFLAGGGDGYAMLKKAEKLKVIGSLREIIKNQIQSTGTFSAKCDGRIKVLNR